MISCVKDFKVPLKFFCHKLSGIKRNKNTPMIYYVSQLQVFLFEKRKRIILCCVQIENILVSPNHTF